MVFDVYKDCTCDICYEIHTCYGTGKDEDDVLAFCLDCLKTIFYSSYVQHVKRGNILDPAIVQSNGKHCQGSNRRDEQYTDCSK